MTIFLLLNSLEFIFFRDLG